MHIEVIIHFGKGSENLVNVRNKTILIDLLLSTITFNVDKENRIKREKTCTEIQEQ